jgi:hypothetical protein
MIARCWLNLEDIELNRLFELNQRKWNLLHGVEKVKLN